MTPKEAMHRTTRFLAAIAFALCVVMGTPAFAQAADKDPLEYPLRQWGIVLGFACFGGLASWINKVRKGEVSVFAIAHLVGELVMAAFSGLVCFLVLESLGAPKLVSTAMVAIFGHMGVRGIAILETWGAAKQFGINVKEQRDETPDHR
jgi:hypothetical protein